MDPAVLVVGLVLVFVVAYLVGYPLVRPEEPPAAEIDDGEDDALERRKEVVFTTLGEVEFDYLMGKLSSEEYEALSSQYKRYAVQLLKEEEDELHPGLGPGMTGATAQSDVSLEEIEREIEEEIARELEAMRQGEKD